MSAPLDKLDRANLVRHVMEIRDRCDLLLDVLVPDGEDLVCPHPPDKVVNESTMEDDGEKYHCLLCNTISHTPFHHP